LQATQNASMLEIYKPSALPGNLPSTAVIADFYLDPAYTICCVVEVR